MTIRLLSFALSLSLFAGSVVADDTTYLYVSPDGSDGSLTSIAAARDKIRAMKKQGTLHGAVKVMIRGGTYRLEGPISFEPQDSGTREAPIVYAAQPGEKPIFSGGVPITGWKKSDGPLWTTVVPGVKEGRWNFRTLYVDGRRAIPARMPNEGWFFAAGPIVTWQNLDAADADVNNKLWLRYRDEELKPGLDLEDAVVVAYHSWSTSRHNVKSLDERERIIRFTAPSDWPMGAFEKPQRWFVEFVREGLDSPGEWHLDRSSGVLTYYPRPGEDMAKVETIAPRPEELLRLEGDPTEGKFVEHLRFEGLAFQHTDWIMRREEMMDGFAAMFLKTAAVFAAGARDCRFTRCEIARTGGYALWLSFGCNGNRVEQCHLHDLGAGGVRIGRCRMSDLRADGFRIKKDTNLPKEARLWAARNEVFNCFIHDGGRVFQGGVGVIIGRSSYNKVRHNEICDFDYSGISVGWDWWWYPPSLAHDNLIEYNHIHHLGRGQLCDMAGVYTLGFAPGTIIRNNLVHDVVTYTYRGWGLYADEGTAETLWENNIVYRTRDGGFHDHLGRENMVRNNIFALAATTGQITRNPLGGCRSFTFERNIVYDKQIPPLAKNWATPSYKLDYNLYWHASKAPLVFPGDRTFRQWQQLGYDVHSVVADPRFVDAERYDFRLRPDSPALKLGFKPIDAGEIGLVGPAEWVELPKKVERPVMKLPGE